VQGGRKRPKSLGPTSSRDFVLKKAITRQACSSLYRRALAGRYVGTYIASSGPSTKVRRARDDTFLIGCAASSTSPVSEARLIRRLVFVEARAVVLDARVPAEALPDAVLFVCPSR
jgi:hypothetical protein